MVERAQRRLCWTQGYSREGVYSVSESLTCLCHLNPLSAELENVCVHVRVCFCRSVKHTRISFEEVSALKTTFALKEERQAVYCL